MQNKLYFDSEFDLKIIKQLALEKESIGYYDLPNQNTDYIDEYLQQLDTKNIKDIVIVGIGGSSLGIRAIYHFIKSSKNLTRKMYFMGSTDPFSITNTIKKINIKQAHFIVISKSGNTIETIATYKYLLNFIDKSQFSFITDKNSPLDKYAKENNQVVAYIQKNIGGRFSALSSVGMIPLALAGVDYKKILTGARKIADEFWQMQNTDILKKAYFYTTNKNIDISTIFSYSDSLSYFNGWFVQLWGESLGKKQKNSNLSVGSAPIGLIGPKDQHSFLQLLMEGTHNKSITFITIKNHNSELKIPDITLPNLTDMDNINNIKFADLINKQADSTMMSLKNIKNIPIDEIILANQDEYTIGELIFYFQILTSLMGLLLNIDTYNQPGVELGKQILKDKLNNDK